MANVLSGLPIAQPPAPLPKAAPQMRDFGDSLAARRAIFDNALNAARTLQPTTNKLYTLQLSDVDYADPDTFSIADQKKAILSGTTLARRMRGTWNLRDNETGDLVDQRTMTIGRVPFLTQRGTFINNGTEYSINNQARLRAGVYTREKESGEIESHFNPSVGKGVAHRYYLDPEKGIFNVKFQQANIPLMPMLRALGATDTQLREAWGNELFSANAAKDDPVSFNKLFMKMVGKKELTDFASRTQAVADFINKMEMDPEVTSRTLGKPYKNLNLDAILGITKRLLAVSRGEAETDDRDHMAYQQIMGPEDIIAERLTKDAGGVRRALLHKSTWKKNLSGISPGALDRQITSAILSTGLGQTPEGVNMSEILDKQTRITRMGEGALPSLDSIPDEARSVSTSHFAFVDPVRTPECADGDTEVYTADGWVRWDKVKDNAMFACLIDGHVVFEKASRVIRQPYDGPMVELHSDEMSWCMTPNHRMLIRPQGVDGLMMVPAITLVEKSYQLYCGKMPHINGPGPDFYQVLNSDWSFTGNFRGTVYCATVPGGLLFMRRNKRMGFWTGNSLRAGVDLNLARGAMKGSDGRIYAPFIDAKTGKSVYKSPQDLADLTIAFPGEMKKDSKRITAIRGGKLVQVRKEDVDVTTGHFEDSFSHLSNLVPMKSASKGQRVSMGARFLAQALPIENPEAPFVQSALPEDDTRSFEEEYGKHMGAMKADRPGRVMSVSPDGIKIKYADGKTETHELYNSFPLARKTSFDQLPVVKPGDEVQAGQILARSNYTDDKGTTALGANARVAFVPRGSGSFEDAIAISESFAKRMSSVHAYKHGIDYDDATKTGKKNYVSIFPGKYSRKIMDTIDDDGVVMPGTVVQYGDPLVLGAREREQSRNKIHKKGTPAFGDVTETWDHSTPGVVTDVVKRDKGAMVLTKTIVPMQDADKLSGRYGNKGIVAIYPDEEMPVAADGRNVDVALNPLGVISRSNPSQIVETVLGKIAEKTGKPYKIKDFEDIEDLAQFAADELKKHNMSDKEDVIDPATGRKIPNVLVGNMFLMKLHHQAESKLQGRGTGGYSAMGEPTKGGASGCFIGEQMVQTATGTQPIGDIVRREIPARVKTWDAHNQEWTYRRIVDWFTQSVTPQELVEIELEDGSKIVATTTHEVILEDGSRKHAGELTSEDILKSQ